VPQRRMSRHDTELAPDVDVALLGSGLERRIFTNRAIRVTIALSSFRPADY
jgi:hypothetical protein